MLQPQPAPRGDVIYKNDLGEPVLRATRLGGVTVFTDHGPAGSAARWPAAACRCGSSRSAPRPCGPDGAGRGPQPAAPRGGGHLRDAEHTGDARPPRPDRPTPPWSPAKPSTSSPTAPSRDRRWAKFSTRPLRGWAKVGANGDAKGGELRIVVAPAQGLAGRPSLERASSRVPPSGSSALAPEPSGLTCGAVPRGLAYPLNTSLAAHGAKALDVGLAGRPTRTASAGARRNGLVAFSSAMVVGTVGSPRSRAAKIVCGAGLRAPGRRPPTGRSGRWRRCIRGRSRRVVSSGRAARRRQAGPHLLRRALEQAPAAQREDRVSPTTGASIGRVSGRRCGPGCGRRSRSPRSAVSPSITMSPPSTIAVGRLRCA